MAQPAPASHGPGGGALGAGTPKGAGAIWERHRGSDERFEFRLLGGETVLREFQRGAQAVAANALRGEPVALILDRRQHGGIARGVPVEREQALGERGLRVLPIFGMPGDLLAQVIDSVLELFDVGGKDDAASFVLLGLTLSGIGRALGGFELGLFLRVGGGGFQDEGAGFLGGEGAEFGAGLHAAQILRVRGESAVMANVVAALQGGKTVAPQVRVLSF